MVIIFASEKPRRQLLTHNLVATLRKKPHKVGKDWANAGRGKPKLVDVAISFEGKVKSMRDLDATLNISGFDTVEEWRNEFYRLNPKAKAVKGYLYIVAKLTAQKQVEVAARRRA